MNATGALEHAQRRQRIVLWCAARRVHERNGSGPRGSVNFQPEERCKGRRGAEIRNCAERAQPGRTLYLRNMTAQDIREHARGCDGLAIVSIDDHGSLGSSCSAIVMVNDQRAQPFQDWPWSRPHVNHDQRVRRERRNSSLHGLLVHVLATLRDQRLGGDAASRKRAEDDHSRAEPVRVVVGRNHDAPAATVEKTPPRGDRLRISWPLGFHGSRAVQGESRMAAILP